MLCREMMTADPRYCRPDDTLLQAVEIMRTEDVGPVPVVKDDAHRQLVGIVTDRDIVVKAVAKSRDPQSTRVSEVMSRDLLTCGTEDDHSDAVALMAQHQVRRIPVVNAEGSLVGIISQADVARDANKQDVGEMVEEISEGAGSRKRQSAQSSSAVNVGFGPGTLLAATACLAGGAGLMYFFDPNRGRRRRRNFARATSDAYQTSSEYAGKIQRELRDRTASVLHEGQRLSRYTHCNREQANRSWTE